VRIGTLLNAYHFIKPIGQHGRKGSLRLVLCDRVLHLHACHLF